MKAAWAALFSTRPTLIYSFMRVIRFSCVHCSPRSTGNKALSLSRNNVPLSICAWNNRLQRSAGIAIIDHVCDVCSDIDSESLFNTDEWSPLKPGIFCRFLRAVFVGWYTRVMKSSIASDLNVSILLIAFRTNAVLRSEVRDVWIFRICCEAPSYLYLVLPGMKLTATSIDVHTCRLSCRN